MTRLTKTGLGITAALLMTTSGRWLMRPPSARARR